MPTKTKTATTSIPSLLGIAEIAARYNVSPQLAHKWTTSKAFPKAAVTVRSGRLWLLDEIRAWAKAHRPDLKVAKR